MTADLFQETERLEQIPLQDAEVYYLHHLPLAAPPSTVMRLLISETPWRAEKIVVWGRTFPQPRLIAWYGDSGKNYIYSSIHLNPLPWTPALLAIKTRIEAVAGDAFRFADNRLNNKIEWGFHAVSLDEQRVDFVPTMWANRKNVVQVLFPGAHADVGGGYTTKGGESGLSNGALLWMVDQLNGVGVQISDSIAASNKADAGGVAHQPWRHKPFDLPGRAHPRDFSGTTVREHASIAQRTVLSSVVAEPGEPPSKYKPMNRP